MIIKPILDMKLCNLFMCVAAVAALGSCASSDVIDDIQGSRIGFDTNVSKNSRALTNSNFNRFFVYGTYQLPTQAQPISVFTGDLVTKGDNGSWTYSGDRFWVPEGSYDFYAYSCENQAVNPNLSGMASMSNRALSINGFVANESHQHDLLFAKVEKQTRQPQADGQTPAPVALRFAHLLTRVKFTFKSAYPSGYTVTVSNPKLINFRDKGDYQGDNEQWANVTRTKENVELALALKGGSADITAATASTDPVYLIPFLYQQADVMLTFDVEVKKGNQNVLGRTITAHWQPAWQSGHSLNNEITVTGGSTGLGPIRFTASIVDDSGASSDGWNDEQGSLNGMWFEAQ